MIDRQLASSRPVARKRHRCDSCGAAIEPGARYCYQFNVIEGEAGSFRAHLDCEQASRIAGAAQGLGPGDVWLNVSDFDTEDRAAVAAADPALAARLWPADWHKSDTGPAGARPKPMTGKD